MKLSLLLGFFLSNESILFSQNVYDKDPYKYNGQHVEERRVVPWPNLKESDILFAKRIIRVIDSREKQNEPMTWPQSNLAQIIYKGILEGKLIAYKNDSLKSIFKLHEFIRIGTDTEVISIPIDITDPEGLTKDSFIVTNFIPDLRIKKYRLVEDWIYDQNRSQYCVRIIAIAPQYELKFGGIDLGYQDLCVLKYSGINEKDLRHYLVNFEIFNRQTSSSTLTFDDWF